MGGCKGGSVELSGEISQELSDRNWRLSMYSIIHETSRPLHMQAFAMQNKKVMLKSISMFQAADE